MADTVPLGTDRRNRRDGDKLKQRIENVGWMAYRGRVGRLRHFELNEGVVERQYPREWRRPFPNNPLRLELFAGVRPEQHPRPRFVPFGNNAQAIRPGLFAASERWTPMEIAFTERLTTIDAWLRTRTDGQLEFDRVLGYGGMGLTALYRDKTNNRDIVVKFAEDDSEMNVRPLRTEKKAMRTLQGSPYCVGLIEDIIDLQVRPLQMSLEDYDSSDDDDPKLSGVYRPPRRQLRRLRPTRRDQNKTDKPHRNARKRKWRDWDKQNRKRRGFNEKHRNQANDHEVIFMEFCEHGTLEGLVNRLGRNNNNENVPNRVLWSFWLCLLRACLAMDYPHHPALPDQRLAAKTAMSRECKALGISLDDKMDFTPAGNPPGVNIVHFDMDPSNLFICALQPGNPEHWLVPKLKVGDFGLAHQIRPQKSNYYYNRFRFPGKDGFRAPEQYGPDWEYYESWPPEGHQTAEHDTAGSYGSHTNIYAAAMSLWSLITKCLPSTPPQPQIPPDRPLEIKPWDEHILPNEPVSYCLDIMHDEQTWGHVDETLRKTINECLYHKPLHRPTLETLLRQAEEQMTLVKDRYPEETDELIRAWVDRWILLSIPPANNQAQQQVPDNHGLGNVLSSYYLDWRRESDTLHASPINDPTHIGLARERFPRGFVRVYITDPIDAAPSVWQNARAALQASIYFQLGFMERQPLAVIEPSLSELMDFETQLTRWGEPPPPRNQTSDAVSIAYMSLLLHAWGQFAMPEYKVRLGLISRDGGVTIEHTPPDLDDEAAAAEYVVIWVYYDAQDEEFVFQALDRDLQRHPNPPPHPDPYQHKGPERYATALAVQGLGGGFYKVPKENDIQNFVPEPQGHESMAAAIWSLCQSIKAQVCPLPPQQPTVKTLYDDLFGLYTEQLGGQDPSWYVPNHVDTQGIAGQLDLLLRSLEEDVQDDDDQDQAPLDLRLGIITGDRLFIHGRDYDQDSESFEHVRQKLRVIWIWMQEHQQPDEENEFEREDHHAEPPWQTIYNEFQGVMPARKIRDHERRTLRIKPNYGHDYDDGRDGSPQQQQQEQQQNQNLLLPPPPPPPVLPPNAIQNRESLTIPPFSPTPFSRHRFYPHRNPISALTPVSNPPLTPSSASSYSSQSQTQSSQTQSPKRRRRTGIDSALSALSTSLEAQLPLFIPPSLPPAPPPPPTTTTRRRVVQTYPIRESLYIQLWNMYNSLSLIPAGSGSDGDGVPSLETSRLRDDGGGDGEPERDTGKIMRDLGKVWDAWWERHGKRIVGGAAAARTAGGTRLRLRLGWRSEWSRIEGFFEDEVEEGEEVGQAWEGTGGLFGEDENDDGDGDDGDEDVAVIWVDLVENRWVAWEEKDPDWEEEVDEWRGMVLRRDGGGEDEDGDDGSGSGGGGGSDDRNESSSSGNGGDSNPPIPDDSWDQVFEDLDEEEKNGEDYYWNNSFDPIGASTPNNNNNQRKRFADDNAADVSPPQKRFKTEERCIKTRRERETAPPPPPPPHSLTPQTSSQTPPSPQRQRKNLKRRTRTRSEENDTDYVDMSSIPPARKRHRQYKEEVFRGDEEGVGGYFDYQIHMAKE